MLDGRPVTTDEAVHALRDKQTLLARHGPSGGTGRPASTVENVQQQHPTPQATGALQVSAPPAAPSATATGPASAAEGAPGTEGARHKAPAKVRTDVSPMSFNVMPGVCLPMHARMDGLLGRSPRTLCPCTRTGTLQERVSFCPHPKTLTMAGDYEYFSAQVGSRSM